MCPASSHTNPEPLPAATSCASPRKSTMMRVWVTKTVLGATARKTVIVLRSSSVRPPGPRGAGGTGEGTRGAALDVGGGGGDVDRHAKAAESPKSPDRMRPLVRTLRR